MAPQAAYGVYVKLFRSCQFLCKKVKERCDFRAFSGLLTKYRLVAIKLPLRALQITASRPSNYRFVIRIPKPSSRACRGFSESQCKGKNFSLRSTNNSPVFFIILRFFFRLARQPSGHLVIWSFVKIEKRCCQNRHYNINILFIYSEQ